MPYLSRRHLLAYGAAATAFAPALPVFAAAPAKVSVDAAGHAIGGYDTTTYWTAGAALAGTQEHVAEWHDVPWKFATAQAATDFSADPQAFAPQFGGFCTRAMSFGKVVDGDPEVWRIHAGKLYLFAKPVGGRKFDEGQGAMIEKAQANWDKLHTTG